MATQLYLVIHNTHTGVTGPSWGWLLSYTWSHTTLTLGSQDRAGDGYSVIPGHTQHSHWGHRTELGMATQLYLVTHNTHTGVTGQSWGWLLTYTWSNTTLTLGSQDRAGDGYSLIPGQTQHSHW